MVHSITKKTDFGYSKIEVGELKEKKEISISIFYYDCENILIDVHYIVLNKEDFYNFIGTMLFVQSKISKNEI